MWNADQNSDSVFRLTKNMLTNTNNRIQIFWEIQIKLMPTDTKNILTNSNKRIQILLRNTNKVDAYRYNFFWQIQIKDTDTFEKYK